ncbi:MAG TPA: ABC transporter ATP-binding protein [Candidatus Polarisedimenticolia bacterium]|nr:ABC transporter ATP-binding protein [Candidatus Polarisedimenticolia bacterium]
MTERDTTAGGEILVARALRFGHPGTDLLFDGLTMRIAAGEFLGIIGPNGSGKTTLLRLLCGILAPDGGEVILAGRPIRAYPPRERARLVAFVPQESRLVFDFNVLEVVLMGRSPHLGLLGLERPADFALARAALKALDLEGKEEARLRDLSSGERQRALIARALAQEPRLLLLDEPTAFLDLKHRLQIHDILRRLNRERGLTVVTVSHDLNLAARYGSRLLLLHRGRLAADGPPAAVLVPELIRSVYETEVAVQSDPVTGAPYLIPRAPLP